MAAEKLDDSDAEGVIQPAKPIQTNGLSKHAHHVPVNGTGSSPDHVKVAATEQSMPSVSFVHHEHPNLHEFVQKARQMACFSIAFTLCCACVGFAFAIKSNSSSLMAYSLQALVNVCSSALVLWRFWKDPDGEGQYFEITRRRERRASVCVGFTFVVIGLVIFAQAVAHLAHRKPPGDSQVLLAISSISILVLSWSCIGKSYLAVKLHSTALRKDAIVSGACAVLAGAVLLSTSIYKHHPHVWWLDATCALLVSVTLPLLGYASLTRNRWWKRSFWTDDDLTGAEKVGPVGGMLPSEARELGQFARILSEEPSSAAVEMPTRKSSRK